MLVERRAWAVVARRGCQYSDADSLMCSEALAALEIEARSGLGRERGGQAVTATGDERREAAEP